MGGRLESDVLIELSPDGSIGALGPRAGRPLQPGTLDLSTRVVLPGTCNVHSHSFQVLLRGRCEAAASFSDWVRRLLYPLVRVLDVEDVRAAALLAFTEMLLNGVTAVGEFHYLHAEPGGEDGENRYERAVLDAARSVGLRACLLRAFYDQGGVPGRERFVESPELARSRLEELEREVAEDPLVTVGAAPHSLHGASPEAFRLADEWSHERGRPIHVHLAEQRGDVEFARERFGASPGRVLDRLGLLSPRLVVVHGCWLDEAEIRRLGEAGTGLAYNPSSNMALGDGVTDLAAFHRAGVRMSLGTDGACANNQFDVYREMRTAEHLQRVSALRMGVLTPGRGALLLHDMGTRNGYEHLGLSGGVLEPGRAADLVALDPDDPSLQPADWDGLEPADGAALLCAQVAFGMSVRGALRDVVIGGRHVVEEGRPRTVDVREVVAAVRRRAPWTRI